MYTMDGGDVIGGIGTAQGHIPKNREPNSLLSKATETITGGTGTKHRD